MPMAPAEISLELDLAIKGITILSFFGGLGGIWWKSAQWMARLEETFTMSLENQGKDITELKENGKQIVAVLTKMAVYDEQIATLRREITELKHGQGFIVKPKAAYSDV